MAEQLVIDSRFRGPAASGNGGYSCGVLARFVDPHSAQVTLRLPPPLDRPLDVEAAAGRAELRDGDAVVAQAEAVAGLELEVPAGVSVEEAAAARDASPMQREHPYPECFVCGPGRRAGDGLRVTCGPIRDELVASPWEADGSLAGEDGRIPAEIVWSVLDCPGGIAGMLLPDLGVSVLGRLTASIDGEAEPGTTYVAIGWPIDRDGRKLEAGSAILTGDGEVIARARATWIELKS